MEIYSIIYLFIYLFIYLSTIKKRQKKSSWWQGSLRKKTLSLLITFRRPIYKMENIEVNCKSSNTYRKILGFWLILSRGLLLVCRLVKVSGWAVNKFTWRRLDHMEDGFLHSVGYKFIKQLIRSSLTFQNWHLRHLWSSDLFYIRYYIPLFICIIGLFTVYIFILITHRRQVSVKVSTVKFFRGIKLKKEQWDIMYWERVELAWWWHDITTSDQTICFLASTVVLGVHQTQKVVYLWCMVYFKFLLHFSTYCRKSSIKSPRGLFISNTFEGELNRS